ncbi:MAG TPA: thioredoxin domain-containing protein, partial [Terriglobia bacterium]|nr:thioredoxin domain-containing protein [Terriglobia bacterium]
MRILTRDQTAMSIHTRPSRRRLGKILSGGVLLLFSQGTQIGLGQNDGQALQILMRMAETYRGLKSYQFEGVMKQESKAVGYQQTGETPILKAAVLPDKLRIEWGWPKNNMVLVSNAQDSWLYLAQVRHYSKTKPADTKRFLKQGPSDEPATLSALYNSFVIQYANLPDGIKRARILREESLDLGGNTKSCYVVEINSRETVVLLNFWATWCGPCRIEMPLLDQLQKEYRDQGLVVLGLTDETPEL